MYSRPKGLDLALKPGSMNLAKKTDKHSSLGPAGDASIKKGT